MGKFYFQWHITNKCNNRCSHCYQDDYSQIEVSMDMVDNILDDIKKFCEVIECEPKIGFVGGDPFRHSRFKEILEKSRMVSNDINILGNPEVLLDNPSIIDYLKKIGINSYQLSLDGLKDTHDSIRYRGSYDKTLKAIQLLSENGINVAVMSTVTTNNYKEMKEVMDVAYSKGAMCWTFSRCVTDNKSLLIDTKEYMRFLEDIVRKHKYYENLGKQPLVKEPLLSLVYKKLGYKNIQVWGCGIGGAMLTIMPDGEVMACRRHPGSSLGKWSEDNNFVNIFLFNKILKEFRFICISKEEKNHGKDLLSGRL